MTTNKEQFRVLPEHITLLTNAWVGWRNQGYDSGAPGVDGTHPYGSKHVIRRVAELLGVKVDNPKVGPMDDLEDYYDDDLYLPDTYAHLRQLHRDTENALQIFLHTQAMQPGLYERSVEWGARWSRISD